MLNQTKACSVRKPVEEIRVPVHKLFEQVLEVSKNFSKEPDKQIAFAEGQAILDRKDGDCQKNRFAMRRLLRDAEKWVKSEVVWKAADEARDAAKAVALAEYEDLVAPVEKGWAEAKEAWMKYVQAENAMGHKGQWAIWQGTRSAPGLWVKFSEMETKIKAVRGTEEAVAALTAELASLTEEASNFFVPNWCKHNGCGAPIEATMTPRGGGKPFPISYCHEHESDKGVKSSGSGKAKSQSEPDLNPEAILEQKAADHRANEEHRLANIRKNDLAKTTRKSRAVTQDGKGGKKTKKTSNKRAPVADLANGEKEPAKARVVTARKSNKAE